MGEVIDFNIISLFLLALHVFILSLLFLIRFLCLPTLTRYTNILYIKLLRIPIIYVFCSIYKNFIYISLGHIIY